jgi:hypothetical protein
MGRKGQPLNRRRRRLTFNPGTPRGPSVPVAVVATFTLMKIRLR